MNEELIDALEEKVRHLDKMKNHLSYSLREVQGWWSVGIPFANWSDRQLESLVAFKSRFTELQDHLASAMRLIANIENEDSRMFTYVLNYMEQLEVLDDVRQWQKVRDLRNAATHDYSESDEVKSMHFESLLQSTPYLFSILENLKTFVLTHYSGNEK